MRNSIVEEDLKRIISFDLPWERLSDKVVLVTGANGSLPAYMVETLLYLNEVKKLNIKIIGLARNEKKAFKRFLHYQKRSDLKLIIQDVSAPLSLKGRIDYIIHAASQASPKYFGKDPVGTLAANVLGTYNLLELAREKQAKGFLFFSSSEIYGQVDDSQIPIKESSYGYLDPTDVRSSYAESKRMGETMCVSWHHQYGVAAKIVRPFHIYGPGMSPDDGRVYADFIADILNDRDIVMKSDGSASRAFCYLADAAQAFFAVLFRGEDKAAYNVGNPGCEISILGLANKLVSLFPEKKLKVVKKDSPSGTGYLKSSISRIAPDISKIKQLGWQPMTSIEKGFTRTVRSFV